MPTIPPMKLANLGPKSLQMLQQAQIHSEQQICALGAVKTYWLVKQCCPQASLNLLWALEGYLSQRDWREVAKQDKLSLLLALEEVKLQIIHLPTVSAS